MLAGNDGKFMTRVSLLTQPKPEKKPKPEQAESNKTESTESK
jgi:hypothetical protein